MTDLEMVRLCAEAMDLGCYEVDKNKPEHTIRLNGQTSANYWPLTDDEQAMALLKKFKLRVDFDEAALDYKPTWYAQTFDYKRSKWNKPAENGDLNRAIVECVAKIRRASTLAK